MLGETMGLGEIIEGDTVFRWKEKRSENRILGNISVEGVAQEKWAQGGDWEISSPGIGRESGK